MAAGGVASPSRRRVPSSRRCGRDRKMAASRTLLLALLLTLLLTLLPPGPPAQGRAQQYPGLGRRFAEFKRCADAECIMLMSWGEALGDFTAPDCCFVNLRKSDPVYTYDKLAGGSPELWAGHVGRIFGYFPKDLVRVHYEYTKEELQVPADETDFVCFNEKCNEYATEQVGVSEGPVSAAADPGGGLGVSGQDRPIIHSFFREQQALQRLLGYGDAHELQARLQNLSAQRTAAQRESLSYIVNMLLDKVFRASEADIPSAAEKRTDAGEVAHRGQGLQDICLLEEDAVLDEVQDLVYLARDKHAAEGWPGPPSTAPPLEEGWRGPAEETRAPPGDPFPGKMAEDPSTQLPEEPGLWSQPGTRHAGVSAAEHGPHPEEEDAGPGLMTTPGSLAEPVGAEMSGEEEPAGSSPAESTVVVLPSFVPYLSKMLVATLPEGALPGPDFDGLPWKPVLLTAFLGNLSLAIFAWRTLLADIRL